MANMLMLVMTMMTIIYATVTSDDMNMEGSSTPDDMTCTDDNLLKYKKGFTPYTYWYDLEQKQ